ncbi:MAG TPA: Clp protease N-terminal domain-containing protein [Actinomycetes bacterium]|nr:Clp protease N-terminal domain-containing protein [Actinomycetes bacterium]
MFERFTEDARAVVSGAREGAVARGDGWVGSEHLLLAVLEDHSAVARALGELGLTAARVRAQLPGSGRGTPSDDDALRDLGINIDEVRRRAEERFGAGALDEPPAARPAPWWRRGRATESSAHSGRPRFSPEAKKALELAVRESLRLKAGAIALDHVVLGLLRADGPATQVVTALGVEPAAARKAVLRLRRAA